MANILKQIFGLGPKADYAELVKQGAIILDVRSKSEYADGHIKGSINIPVDILTNNLNRLKGKDTPIITCCASGIRSARAKSFLQEAGFLIVHDGGSWVSLKNKLG